MRNQGKVIGGILVGTGLMYLLDPERGARRRALVRDQAVRAGHRLRDGFDASGRDLGNRARGTAAELRSRFRKEEVDDATLHERVRAAIGRAVSHPSAITVSVSNGRVTLHGPVLEPELDRLLRAARRVRGVSDLVNELETYREPEGVSSLQGGRPRGARPELAQENWAPGTRTLMGALGGMLGYWGLRTARPIGPVVALVGAGVLARALTNLPARRLTGIGAGRRAIDLEKSITVAAPIDRIWDLWSNFENFPKFMAHLKEVRRTGDQRSHWVAAGPAGTTLEWDAATTVWVPKERIGWKSVEGSEVESAGVVRFLPNPDGTTRIDVKLSYNPPGGALGHAVARLFGSDPGSAMEEDMVRLKSLLEEGKTSTDQGPVRLDEPTT